MNGPLLARIAVALFVVHGGYGWYMDRPVSPPSGVLAPDEPLQQNVDPATPVVHGHWTLTPRASYDITARVLGRERYSFDTIAALVPVDLALGWGPMSDGAVLAPLKIEQGARFYTVRWGADPPLAPDEIMRHSANTHTIPATAAIGRRLSALRVGQVVHLTGWLVDGVRDDGVTMRTSLTREDTGAGACEVMLVENLDVVRP